MFFTYQSPGDTPECSKWAGLGAVFMIGRYNENKEKGMVRLIKHKLFARCETKGSKGADRTRSSRSFIIQRGLWSGGANM